MADDRSIRTFGQFVQQLEDGQLVADLADRMQELNGKLAKHAEGTMSKAKGEIVLKLKFAADPGGSVAVDTEVTIKEPKPLRSRTVMFLTKDNLLSHVNPRQMPLGLKEVVMEPKAPPKEATKSRAAAAGAKHDDDGVVQ